MEVGEEDVKKAVEELFTNGMGAKAERIVLIAQDGRDLGGWGKKPLIDQLCRSFGIVQKTTK